MPKSSTPTARVQASRGRRQSHLSGDDREQAILATAERLLLERPLADFSVDDLAKGAGISRPTFYFYFPSKNAVLLSLLDDVNVRARSTLVELRQKRTGDPETDWRARIEAFFDVLGAHRAVTIAGAAAKPTNPEVQTLWSKMMDGWIELNTAAIEAERRRGAAPTTVPAKNLAVALNLLTVRVITATFAEEKANIPEKEVVDTLVHIWMASIYDR